MKAHNKEANKIAQREKTARIHEFTNWHHVLFMTSDLRTLPKFMTYAESTHKFDT